MKIINMVSDYEQLCIESDIYGNWIAWNNYVSKYESLFTAILKGLYMSNLEELKPMIEHIDFSKIYNKVQENVRNGYIEEVLTRVDSSMEYFENEKDFTVYIGCEVGNIAACVLPVDGDVVVYFGIETVKSIEDLNSLVPHEINHFIRQSSLIKQSNFKVEQLNTFKERIVAEGLGVFTAANISNLQENLYNLSKILGIPMANVQTLLDQEKDLEKELLSQINDHLNTNMMGKYFGYTEKDMLANKPIYSGYFIGFRIIQKLYNTRKYSLQQLTVLSSDKILEEYLKLDNL